MLRTGDWLTRERARLIAAAMLIASVIGMTPIPYGIALAVLWMVPGIARSIADYTLLPIGV
jgi:hypothetical protein